MKSAALMLLVVGAASWASVSHPRAAPGLLLIVLGVVFAQVSGLIATRDLRSARHETDSRSGLLLTLTFARLAFGFLGIVYLVALVGGTPTNATFWAIFGPALALVVPAWLLWRYLFWQTQGDMPSSGGMGA